MTDHRKVDIALKTLLELRSTVAPELSEDLLRACYFVQKNNQFNNDRSIPMIEMEKLIDGEVQQFSLETEHDE